jgi:hypothetical protein
MAFACHPLETPPPHNTTAEVVELHADTAGIDLAIPPRTQDDEGVIASSDFRDLGGGTAREAVGSG